MKLKSSQHQTKLGKSQFWLNIGTAQCESGLRHFLLAMSALTTDSGVTGEYDRLIEHNGKSCRRAYGHAFCLGNSTLVRVAYPSFRPHHNHKHHWLAPIMLINQMIHEIITGQGLWGIKGSKNTYWVQMALIQWRNETVGLSKCISSLRPETNQVTNDHIHYFETTDTL